LWRRQVYKVVRWLIFYSMSPRMWMDGWMDDETLTPAQFFCTIIIVSESESGRDAHYCCAIIYWTAYYCSVFIHIHNNQKCRPCQLSVFLFANSLKKQMQTNNNNNNCYYNLNLSYKKNYCCIYRMVAFILMLQMKYDGCS